MCLLTAKPAALLPLLADDLGEVPRRSHGCTKERSGATSFESNSSLRIPWDIEWVATAFGGKQLRGSTILVTNEEGKIDHAVVQHRPLDGLLAFSAELGKRMSGVEDSDSFWKEYER